MTWSGPKRVVSWRVVVVSRHAWLDDARLVTLLAGPRVRSRRESIAELVRAVRQRSASQRLQPDTTSYRAGGRLSQRRRSVCQVSATPRPARVIPPAMTALK